MILRSVIHAETRLNRPVFVRDIIESMRALYYFALSGTAVWVIAQDLFRNDELLGDAELNRFSARPEMQDTPIN
jgi:hypothetical protein